MTSQIVGLTDLLPGLVVVAFRALYSVE